MSVPDQFESLARYYDGIMEHVNYERWFVVSRALSRLLPGAVRHLDAGCGTGTLVARLREAGWPSIGIDFSYAMLASGCKKHGTLPVAVADLRALPCAGSIHLLTCLFDTLNFLLEEADVRQAIGQFHCALAPGGLLYFDMVTERMVAVHFEDQTWTEDNGGFKTTWSNTYDRATRTADTRLRVNTGVDSLIRERIYPLRFVEEAIHAAGLTLLATYDAETWRAPTRRTTRVDFIAAKHATPNFRNASRRSPPKSASVFRGRVSGIGYWVPGSQIHRRPGSTAQDQGRTTVKHAPTTPFQPTIPDAQ